MQSYSLGGDFFSKFRQNNTSYINSAQAVNPERRRLKAIMKQLGLTGGRQKRKLRKLLKRLDAK